MFCGKNERDSEKIKKIFENCVEELGLKVIKWRDVPIAPDKIGKTAREIMPILQQVFVGSEGDDIIDDIEQKLFIIRKKFENIILNDFDDDIKIICMYVVYLVLKLFIKDF